VDKQKGGVATGAPPNTLTHWKHTQAKVKSAEKWRDPGIFCHMSDITMCDFKMGR